MKKAILLVLAGVLGGSLSALADVERANKLTPLQRQQIAWALKLLGETKTLVTNQNQCMELDQDILNVLEADGHIEQRGTHPTTICVGPVSATK